MPLKTSHEKSQIFIFKHNILVLFFQITMMFEEHFFDDRDTFLSLAFSSITINELTVLSIIYGYGCRPVLDVGLLQNLRNNPFFFM